MSPTEALTFSVRPFRGLSVGERVAFLPPLRPRLFLEASWREKSASRRRKTGDEAERAASSLRTGSARRRSGLYHSGGSAQRARYITIMWVRDEEFICGFHRTSSNSSFALVQAGERGREAALCVVIITYIWQRGVLLCFACLK